jgi:DNA-directed RNA polymerase specialized sigma24 family protein
MLSTPRQVVWALITYTDWWQPNTSSVYQLGNRRDSYVSDGIRGGLLDTLSERDELCRRMQRVPEMNRRLLYLWYLRQLPVEEIARELRLSRRQCFRRRADAIKTIVELGGSAIVENIPA